MEQRVNPKKLLDCLGITRQEFQGCAGEPIEKFRSLVKMKYRDLAFEHHPDKGGSEEKMKEINNAVDLLMKVGSINLRPPQPVVYASYQFYSYGGTSSATTSHGIFRGGFTS